MPNKICAKNYILTFHNRDIILKNTADLDTTLNLLKGKQIDTSKDITEIFQTVETLYEDYARKMDLIDFKNGIEKALKDIAKKCVRSNHFDNNNYGIEDILTDIEEELYILLNQDVDESNTLHNPSLFNNAEKISLSVDADKRSVVIIIKNYENNKIYQFIVKIDPAEKIFVSSKIGIMVFKEN